MNETIQQRQDYQPQICRLCLSLTNTSFSLTEVSEASEMLQALTSLQILPSDEISTIMCLKCFLNLKLAFKIQQNMVRAEHRFHERLPVIIKDEFEFIQKTENEMPELLKEIDYIQMTKSEVSDQTPEPFKKVDYSQKTESEMPEPSKKLKHTCNICGKENSSSLMLVKHNYKVHELVECTKCLATITRQSLRRHLSRHCKADSLQQLKSEVCVKVDNVPLEHKVDLEEYICDICQKSYPSIVSLKKHKSNSHVYKECPTCKKRIVHTGLKKHLESHERRLIKAAQKAERELNAEKVEYPCDICEKILWSKECLRKHKYDVHLRAECPMCKKQITKINLKRHIERHSNPLVVCDLCGLSYKRLDLRHHYSHVHENRSYKCQFCEKVFKSRGTKVDHEKRQHLGEADFVCDTCGKKFYKSSSLRKHIKSTHLKLRPHICEFCNVGFSSKFALRTHQRQHTNEKPFKCEFCGEGFRQNVSLKSHLKSQHDVEEELICECKECGKKFASTTALFSHGRIHF